MTIFFIATTGNDTTGTGAVGAPWATFSKAISVAVAGDTINAADGTYAENTSASGAWTIAKNVASDITIQSTNGVAANVLIVGTAGVSNTIFSGGASGHLVFRNITFGSRSGSSYALRFNAACSNLAFEDCVFDASGNASAIAGIFHGSATAVVTTTTFLRCTTTTSPSGGYNGGVYLIPTGVGTIAPQFTDCTLAGLVRLSNSGAGGTFTNCAISGTSGLVAVAAGAISISGGSVAGTTGNAINANGAAITIGNCAISNTGAATTAVLGVDGTAGNVTTGSITRCVIRRSTANVGHGLLVGAGCANVVVESVLIPQAYDYACIIKECAGAVVRSCVFVGGVTVAANAALYCKAATGVNAHHNWLIGGSSFAVRVLKGDTGNKSGTITLVDNRIRARLGGGAVALDWGDSANDSGGGVCDRNRYETRTAFGAVFGSSGLKSIAALRAAWATYSVPTNDGASRRGEERIPL